MNNDFFELGFIKAAAEQGVDEEVFLGFMSVLKTAAPFGVPTMPQQETHLPTSPGVSVPVVNPQQNPFFPGPDEVAQAQASAAQPRQTSLPPGSVTAQPPPPPESGPKPPAGAFGGAVQGGGGPDYGFPKA